MSVTDVLSFNNSVMINQTFQNVSNFGTTPLYLFISFFVIAAALVVVCLSTPLRNSEGKLSVERTILSLVSTAWLGITAYLGIAIDTSDGVSSIVINNTSAIVSMHSIYNLPAIPIFCAVMSVVMFGVFIHCVTSPEMLQPDNNERNGPGGRGDRK
jgi:hypothetical protein